MSPELVVRVERRPDGTEKVVTRPNPDSAAAWHYGGEEPRPGALREFRFGRTMSSVCVVGGVLYAAELTGYVHCLDARTGKRYWVYDTKASIWGSPFYCDGKVYLADDGGDLLVFRHRPGPAVGPDPNDVPRLPFSKMGRVLRRQLHTELEAKVLLRKVELDAMIRTTPCVAGGVLYVATEKTLHAAGVRR